MREIDLHVHTNISDGSETPENTVRLAGELGLRAIAVTDHDNVGGIAEAAAAGEKYGVEVVPGLELACGWYGREIHMLGYDIDPDSEELQETVRWIIYDRRKRNEQIAKLISDDGVKIDIDELEASHRGSTIGRPHFALRLVEAGRAKTLQEAFDTLLNPGCRYFIRRNFLTLEEGAETIRSAGGKPVIAHPGQYRLDRAGMEELLERGKKAMVAGLECYYSGYTEEQTALYRSSARRYGLCVTAGSDWHGKNKERINLGSGIDGELCAPYELLEKLREHD